MNRSLRAHAWRPTRAGLIAAGVIAFVLLLLLGGSMVVAGVRASSGPDRVLSQGRDVAVLVAQVAVADPQQAPGFDRDCGSGHGCVFGPPKTDRHAGPGGFNGCDGFNDLARAQMDDVVVQADTRGCVVASGTLTDRYTGEQIHYQRGSSTMVSIEHVRALKSAWDAGAWAWPVQQRIDFANDQQLNLLLVSQAVNSSKGDRGPGQWMPPNRNNWCDYLARYLQVSIKWALPISPADHARAVEIAPTCSALSADPANPNKAIDGGPGRPTLTTSSWLSRQDQPEPTPPPCPAAPTDAIASCALAISREQS
ncbi:MAG: HNH endonuclease family protein [Dermatophilaceae bacterium]